MQMLIWLASVLAISPLGQPIENAGSEMEGVWQTDDHTRLLDIGSDGAAVYDQSSVVCLESERVSRDGLRSVYSHVTFIERDRVRFWDEGETVEAFRLHRLPPHCGATASDASTNEIAEAMAAYFAENYTGFASRNVSREDFIRRLRELGTGDSDSFWTGTRALFRELDDAHLFASNRKEGAASRSAVSAVPSGLRAALGNRSDKGSYRNARERIQSAHAALIQDEVLAGEWWEGANGKLTWGWLRPRLAYIRMPALTGWTEQRFDTIAPYIPVISGEMDRMVGAIGEAEAVVLDIRGNRGGNDTLMQTIAAYFLSAPALYRWRRLMPHGWSEWRDIRVEPDERALKVPIYLLIDRNTVSSAELIALLLGQNDGVVTIGETTRGAVSAVRFMQLPGGGFIGMPYQQLARLDGYSPEGGGMSPEISVPSFPESRIISGYRDAIDHAASLYDLGSER